MMFELDWLEGLFILIVLWFFKPVIILAIEKKLKLREEVGE